MAEHWDFAECRSLGHSWSVGASTTKQYMKVAILECARCGTTRSDVRSAKDGAVLWRSYDYSEGYQVPDKADRPTRATYTLAMLNEQGSMNEEAAVPIVKMMKGRRS